jgi:hypothetical protein
MAARQVAVGGHAIAMIARESIEPMTVRRGAAALWPRCARPGGSRRLAS